MIFSMRSLMLALCACGVFSAPLKADELIRAAQSRLSKLGYYKGQVDGSSGSMTCAAIRRFQVAGNLKVTGELNQQTITELGINKAVPAPSYTAIGGLFSGGPLARSGSEAQVAAIRQAQAKLAELGFYGGKHNGLPSEALTTAIKDWQTASKRRPTGKLDTATIEGLKLGRPAKP